MINFRGLLFFSFLFLIPLTGYTQALGENRAKEFINALISDSESINKYILPAELEKSDRLGIKYNDIKNKFLIGNDIDESIKSGVLKSGLKYNIAINKTDNVYSVLEFSIPDRNYFKKYFFQNEYLVSQVYYYTHNWKRIESKHLIYIVSDESILNEYALNSMENFLNNECEILKIDKTEFEKNKIHYVLCKDQDEIEKITGYKSLGMCDLAYDYVLSTFPCHYHELSHLLLNYKLKNISLYTNTFLQEGFAVAMGGRGGREPYIIHNVGYFLARSGFADYRELLNWQKFKGEDASISYPLSGLYNLFLIRNLGIDKYLDLYKKYSTGEKEIELSEISVKDLPDENEWNLFLNRKFKPQEIALPEDNKYENIIYKTDNLIICDSYGYYEIGIKDTAFLKEKNPPQGYICSRFKELFPGKNYTGEKYAFISDAKEILIYNLYTNNLIMNYVPYFSIPPVKEKTPDGFFIFMIAKHVFGEELKEMDFIK